MDEPRLTAADRCDSCGARAYWRFANADTDMIRFLTFCAHHGAQHGRALRLKGWVGFDQTAELRDDETTHHDQ